MYKIFQSVQIPIIGIGGVASASDIIQLMLAGASLVQIGTTNFINCKLGVDVLPELQNYCVQHNIEDISDIIGKVEVY